MKASTYCNNNSSSFNDLSQLIQKLRVSLGLFRTPLIKSKYGVLYKSTLCLPDQWLFEVDDNWRYQFHMSEECQSVLFYVYVSELNCSNKKEMVFLFVFKCMGVVNLLRFSMIIHAVKIN